MMKTGEGRRPPYGGHAKRGRERTRGDPNLPVWREVTDFLRSIRFKRRVFGGVDEADVWRKIERLNLLYEEALRAERIRYDALLAERRGEERNEGWAEDA